MTTHRESLSPEYRTLVETANLDWQVQEYIRCVDHQHEHSGFQIKAAAIAEIAVEQHGSAFDDAVHRYRPDA